MSSQTIITLTGDEKSAYEAFKKVVEAAKQLGNETEKAGRKARAAKNDFDFRAQSKDFMQNMTTSIVSVTGSIGLLTEALSMASAEYEKLNKLGKEHLGKTRTIAGAQQEAAKNLAGTSKEDIRKLLVERVPEIALKSSFPDLAALSTAIGAAGSIVGGDRAESVVQVAADFTQLTPDQLQEVTGAVGDLTNAFGSKDARESISALLSTGSVARPEQLGPLAKGAARVVAANKNATAGTQSKEASGKEALALYSVLGVNDPMGDSSSNAASTFIGQLDSMFSDLGAKEREQKAADLAMKRDRAADDLIGTQDQVAIRKEKAARFGNATTPVANAARHAVTSAENEVKRVTEEIAQMDKEMAELSSITAMRMSDPGTTTGRLEAISKNPAARDYLLSNLKGEEAYKPLMTNLLTEGSEERERLNTALTKISTNPQVYEAAKETLVVTPHQQVARLQLKNETATNVQAFRDQKLEMAAYLKEMTEQVEADNVLPMGPSYKIGSFFRNFRRDMLGIPDDMAYGNDYDSRANQAERAMNEVVNESAPWLGTRTPEQQSYVDLTKQRLGFIKDADNLMQSLYGNTDVAPQGNTSNLYSGVKTGVSDGPNQSFGTEYPAAEQGQQPPHMNGVAPPKADPELLLEIKKANELAQKQADLMREQNELLRQRPNQEPASATITPSDIQRQSDKRR